MGELIEMLLWRATCVAAVAAYGWLLLKVML